MLIAVGASVAAIVLTNIVVVIMVATGAITLAELQSFTG